MSTTTPSRRVLAPRTNRSSVEKLFKDQTKYFLNDDIDTQQWEATSENDPALPAPSSSRTSTWVSQRRGTKRRMYDEEEASKVLEETDRERVPISPELHAGEEILPVKKHYSCHSPPPDGFDDLPEPDDLPEETYNHPEYPHDLDISLTQDQNEEFEFSTAAAIDTVEDYGREIARLGTSITAGAHTVDMNGLHNSVERLDLEVDGVRKAVKRLQSKVYIAGSSV